MKSAKLKKMDMHVHTRFSVEGIDLGVVKVGVNMVGDPVELYKKAKKLGMDYVTFTDHDTIDGCLYFLEKMPHVKDFIISEEITTYDPEYKFVIHVNAYNITKHQHKSISKIRKDFTKLIKYLKNQNIFYTYNHPYWHRHLDYVITTKKPKKRVYEVAKNFSVIEGINSYRLLKQNSMAQEMAKALNLGVTAGSDAHGGDIGRAYTMARANNIKDFLKEVRAGRTKIQSVGYSRKALRNECMNIFYTNVKKIRELYPSKKIRTITNILKPIARIVVRRQVKNNERIQKKIINGMK